MEPQREERRLTTILSADVAGYSRLMGEDEAGTLRALKTHRDELIAPKVAEHKGRIVKLMGDGALVEFPSVVEAVRCAVEIQRGMAGRNTDISEDRRIEFRIGINIGDVIVDGEDIYGDGVNVAARLESISEPGGICVHRVVRDQVRDKLSLAFEDMGEIKVKNIARPVGAFRVVLDDSARRLTTTRAAATIQKWRWPSVAAALVMLVAAAGIVVWMRPWEPSVEPAPSARSDQPGIAVLPFDNMSGDPTQDYFSDGITEDIITDLSRVSGLFVIARNTMFTYKGRPVNVPQVGRDLGVQYVLEGSVRKAGDRIRINAQLVDAGTGRHLWADRYDRELKDVFALQDEVTRRIVSALAVRLTEDEQEQLARPAETSPEAYDMLLRGLERYRRFTPETNAEAREFFEKAVALDPEYARAYADVSLTYTEELFLGWTDSPDEAIRRGLKFGRNALALDDSIRQVHLALSAVYRLQKRHDEAIAAARKSVELDPNHADGYAQMAFALTYAGQPKEALGAMQKAMRLNPRHPFVYKWIVGHAQFLMGQYEEAAQRFENVLKRNPHFPVAPLLLAAAYGHLGRIEDAEWEVDETLTLLPELSLEHIRQTAVYDDPAHLELYIDGLRKAGLPE